MVTFGLMVVASSFSIEDPAHLPAGQKEDGPMRMAFALALCLTCATGCSMIGKAYRPDPMPLPKYQWYKDDGSVDVQVLLSESSVGCVPMPAIGTDAPSCARQTRDRALNKLMLLSDDMCSVHQSNVLSNASTWNVGTGSVTNLLAGIAALGSNSASQANYAAGAVFSNSTRSLVNSEVYMQSLATTIIRAIETLRKERRGAVEQRMKSDNEVVYSFENGYRDVQQYHQACSFYLGISEVSRAVDARADKSDDAQLAVIKLQNMRSLLIAGGAGKDSPAVDKVNKQIEAEIEAMTKAED